MLLQAGFHWLWIGEASFSRMPRPSVKPSEKKKKKKKKKVSNLKESLVV